MKKIAKMLVVLCLFCSLISMTVLAGDSAYSRYGITNSGRRWVSTGSTNTKEAH